MSHQRLDDKIRMSREAPVRFCEGVRVRVPCATRLICTADSKEILETKVQPAIITFLKERGLELSLEKTKITHISEGFDFLGFNIKKYGEKLLIKQVYHRLRNSPKVSETPL